MQHLFEKGISLVEDVVGLFYPRICGGCDAHLMKHEVNLCLQCHFGLPKTYFWDYNVNPVEELFWGRLKVESACAFLHFEKENRVQTLMHRFKYEGKTGIGLELGRSFGHILVEKGWFKHVDLIVAVPLHISKQRRRGFNQSAYIANGLGEVLNVPVMNHLIERAVSSDSQTRKSRFERAENVEQVFRVVHPNKIRGRRVLLVDDVITTGSTLEAVGKELLKSGASELHIATLAIA